MNEKIYIENIIDILHEMGDKKYQQEVWLNTNNPQNFVGSFVDAANMLFDDWTIGELLKDNEIIISRNATDTLYELSKMVDNINEYRPEEEIYNDPKMEAVRQKAAEVLALIEASDGSESTVGFVKVGTADTPITIAEAFESWKNARAR